MSERSLVNRDLRIAASDAVRILVELGMSLERSGDLNRTVNLSAPDASDIVRARLDRLA